MRNFLNPKFQSEMGKRASISNRKNKKGYFFDKKLQSKAGKIAWKRTLIINRKNKTGFCHDRKLQVKGGKATIEKCKKNNSGIFSKNSHKKSQRTRKQLKIGIYNPKVRSKGGKRGQKTIKRLKLTSFHNPKLNRKNRLNIIKNKGTFYFKGIYYDSNSEREFAMNIYYQLEKLKLWENYQVVVLRKHIDFLIERYKCFIEFHPYDLKKLTSNEYYNERREVLNKGGFKDYNLIVIK